MNGKKICIYCASSSQINEAFFNDARTIAEIFAREGYDLVYGGGMRGLMGEIGKTFSKYNRSITSVIPRKLNKPGIIFKDSTEIIETMTINERKGIMERKSDSFLCLAGGFGTLEEILEIISAKQLDFHNKPIAILNTNGFYDSLLTHFNNIFENNFSDKIYRNLYFVSDDPYEILKYIKNYKAIKIAKKFHTL